MIENPYFEKLASSKLNEKPEVVLILAESPDLAKIVIARTNLDVTCSETLTEYKGRSDAEAWEWLWANTIYDLGKAQGKHRHIYARPCSGKQAEKADQ
jgi:hypothetical protein